MAATRFPPSSFALYSAASATLITTVTSSSRSGVQLATPMLAVKRPYSLYACLICSAVIAARILSATTRAPDADVSGTRTTNSSAVSRHAILRSPDALNDALGGSGQGVAAGPVLVFVVIRLEPVRIDKGQREHLSGALCLAPLLPQNLVQGPAIVQPAQRLRPGGQSQFSIRARTPTQLRAQIKRVQRIPAGFRRPWMKNDGRVVGDGLANNRRCESKTWN